MTENAKIFVDSAISLGAIKAKQKHRIDINSRKGRFRTKNMFKVASFAIKIGYEDI